MTISLRPSGNAWDFLIQFLMILGTIFENLVMWTKHSCLRTYVEHSKPYTSGHTLEDRTAGRCMPHHDWKLTWGCAGRCHLRLSLVTGVLATFQELADPVTFDHFVADSGLAFWLRSIFPCWSDSLHGTLLDGWFVDDPQRRQLWSTSSEDTPHHGPAHRQLSGSCLDPQPGSGQSGNASSFSRSRSSRASGCNFLPLFKSHPAGGWRIWYISCQDSDSV